MKSKFIRISVTKEDGDLIGWKNALSPRSLSETMNRILVLESYEDTYYPEHIIGSGRAAYVERNYEMINKSQYCIVYYDEANAPTIRKSGTKIALDYAIRKQKHIIVLPTEITNVQKYAKLFDVILTCK